MKNLAAKSLSALVGLALSLSLAGVHAKQKKSPSDLIHATKTAAPVADVQASVPTAAAKVTPAESQLDNSDVLQAIGGKKRLTRKEKKEQKQQLHEEIEITPILAEVLKLKWQVEPLDA